jgi:hypothetical protein
MLATMKSKLNIRIRVGGRLSERVVSAFDGLTPVRRRETTELVGEVVDQAQLHGLLTRIRDLGLELESVRVTEADSPTPPEDAPTTHRPDDRNPTS